MLRLLLLVGIPGSGKSTLAAQLQQQNPANVLISTDVIRSQLFGDEAIQGDWFLVQREFQQRLRQAVQQIAIGQAKAAIYDATNARRRYRQEAITLARAAGFTHITALWLDVPLRVCLARNRQRQRQVPEAIIQRMHRQLMGAPPSLTENLNCLIHYRSFWEGDRCDQGWQLKPEEEPKIKS